MTKTNPMKAALDDGFAHLTNFLADTELDLEDLDNGMKTTPEGLTHLINMLVDVVNLQRKAQGTPYASCETWLDLSDDKAAVRFYADVDVAAPSLTTLSADNNRDSDEPAA